MCQKFFHICAHLIFYGCSILWTIGLFLLFFPFLLGPKRLVFWLSRLWVNGLLKLAQHLLGITAHITGKEHLPKKGAYIIACKHQSVWETLIFSTFLYNPAFFLKRSLLYAPFAGWFLKKLNMIPVSRSLKKKKYGNFLNTTFCYAIKQNRPIIIFPEGTRVAIGQKKRYRQGIFALYNQFSLPVIPTALNSGLFWKRRGFLKSAGTIELRLLPPLPDKLGKEAFMSLLENAIENTCAQLPPFGCTQKLNAAI
jgi:1-acyl-sn-glycerol-3-phosphate acyltransferase